MYNSYDEMCIAHQKEIDRFPMKFAFGNKQFAEMMSEWGLCNGKDGNPTEDDLKMITSIGCGGYIRVSDIEALKELFDRHDQEKKEFLASKDSLTKAIIKEMFNCEYEINTQGDFDVCNRFGKDESELLEDSMFAECYAEAKKAYYEHQAA